MLLVILARQGYQLCVIHVMKSMQILTVIRLSEIDQMPITYYYSPLFIQKTVPIANYTSQEAE